MPKETGLTAAVARAARIPFWLFARQSFTRPKKALILKPCCVSHVMLATALLSVLSEQFEEARFDWAISDWARPAIVGNSRVTQLLSTGPAGLERSTWAEVRDLIGRIRSEQFDTCFIPDRASLLSFIAWRAGIPQRIGLNVGGRGFAHTLAVQPSSEVRHESEVYLAIAAAVGVDKRIIAEAATEFYPHDSDRTAVTHRLVNELNWRGESPLIIVHPGGGVSTDVSDVGRRWPAERFALLSNHLLRKHEARILLIGDRSERSLAGDISGMVSGQTANWAGKLSLGEIGALCEVSDLYIGNDAGPTHVSAAVGCPTLAIYGPSDPAISGPYASKGRIRILKRNLDPGRSFSWDEGVSAADAIEAADALLEATT
jgi:ADP-heptose:LPS heptosyltransferase